MLCTPYLYDACHQLQRRCISYQLSSPPSFPISLPRSLLFDLASTSPRSLVSRQLELDPGLFFVLAARDSHPKQSICLPFQLDDFLLSAPQVQAPAKCPASKSDQFPSSWLHRTTFSPSSTLLLLLSFSHCRKLRPLLDIFYATQTSWHLKFPFNFPRPTLRNLHSSLVPRYPEVWFSVCVHIIWYGVLPVTCKLWLQSGALHTIRFFALCSAHILTLLFSSSSSSFPMQKANFSPPRLYSLDTLFARLLDSRHHLA